VAVAALAATVRVSGYRLCLPTAELSSNEPAMLMSIKDTSGSGLFGVPACACGVVIVF
jgi:hypothetical protein